MFDIKTDISTEKGAIKIGYFKLENYSFISAISINSSFLFFLSKYANIRIIHVSNMKDICETFKNINKHKLDYVYINSFNFLLASFLLREKLGLDIPFILKIHTVYPWIEEYVRIIPLLRKYDIIFAPSEYAKRSFLKISDKFKVYVIPNCVDLKSIRQSSTVASSKEKKRVVTLTFMGRIVPKKGLEIIIECMPKIVANIGNVCLNIIGPLSGEGLKDLPKSAYVKKIQGLVKRRRLNSKINFIGAQFGADKYRILSTSDIFVNPTLAKEETFGMVNIEALACGIPVVTTRWAGGGEIIKNGSNGYLIDVCRDSRGKPFIDPEELASLIVNALKDRMLNKTLKEKAIISAKKYDYRKVIPALISLLKRRGMEGKVKNRWDFFKNKKAIDFKDFFNRDFLFFLYLKECFKIETYSSLYTRTISNIIETDNQNAHKGNGHGNKIMNRIRQDLFWFLAS